MPDLTTTQNTQTPKSFKNNRALRVIMLIIGLILVLFLLARYIFIKQEVDEYSAGLEQIEQWQTEYKRTHPNASKEEMDQAFRAGIDNFEKWKSDYKSANPGATNSDAEAEFNRLWNK